MKPGSRLRAWLFFYSRSEIKRKTYVFFLYFSHLFVPLRLASNFLRSVGAQAASRIPPVRK